MAYWQMPLDEEERRKTSEGSAGATGATGIAGGPTSPQKPEQQPGSGFINLDKYVGGQAGMNQFADQVYGQVADQGKAADEHIASDEQQYTDAAKAGTVHYDPKFDAAYQPGTNLADEARAKASQGYSGPVSFYNQALNDEVTQAQQNANNTQDRGGRLDLLRQQNKPDASKPEYTQGIAGFDATLLGGASAGKGEGLQKQYGALVDKLRQSQGRMVGTLLSSAGESAAATNSYQNAADRLNQERSSYEQKSKADAEAAAKAAWGSYGERPSYFEFNGGMGLGFGPPAMSQKEGPGGAAYFGSEKTYASMSDAEVQHAIQLYESHDRRGLEAFATEMKKKYGR